MFGSIGLPELLLIFIIALLLFGPRKLPEIGRTLGKAMNEFKRATNDLQRSLEEEIQVDELKKARREVEEAATLTPPAPQPAAAAPTAAGQGTAAPVEAATGEAAAARPEENSGPTETS